MSPWNIEQPRAGDLIWHRRGDYHKAFLACRKHRIDLSVLVEHDEAAFLRRLSSFVDQLEDVDYLNLFLTGLGYGKTPLSCQDLANETTKQPILTASSYSSKAM